MTVIATATPQQAPQNGDLQQKSSEKTEAANFLALLNIGSISAENNATPSAAEPAARPAPRPEAPQQAANPATSDQPRPAAQSNDTPAPREAAQPAQAQQAQPARQTTDKNDDNASQPKQLTPVKSSQQNASQPEDSDIATRQKKIRAQIGEQLDNIAQILQALIAALSASQQATGDTPQQPTGTPATQAAATVAAATDTTDAGTATDKNAALAELTALLSSLSQLAKLTPAATQAATDATSAVAQAATPAASGAIALPQDLAATTTQEDNLALLQDIQALLQQMRANLKAVDQSAPQQQPQAVQAAATPTQPVIILQTDNATPAPQAAAQPQATTPAQQLTSLVQTLDIPATDKLTITVTPAAAQPQESAAATTPLPLPVDISKPQEVIAFLKSSIAQVRDRLQALQNDNEQTYTAVKTSLQQQFEALQATFRAADTAATVAQTAANTVTAAALPATTASTDVTITPTVQTTATPVSIVIAQTPAENNSGGQAGQQNQNNAPQQNATPIAAAQTTNTTSRSEAPSFARTLTRAEPQSLPEQVAYQVKNAVSDGTSKIRIQLDPADLGKLDIKLTVDAQGKAGISILVDNKSTLELLQRDASSLARALNDAGLSTDGSSLNFNLRGGQGDNQQNNQQASNTYLKSQPAEEEVPLQNIISRSYVVNLSDGLDIKI